MVFGLEIADSLDSGMFTLIYFSNLETELEIELIVNRSKAEPCAFGDGYGHLRLAAVITLISNASVWSPHGSPQPRTASTARRG